MLTSFAQRMRVSALTRHLVFAAASLLAILVIGYHFGTFDQTVHIPFLRQIADPALYPTDPFLATRSQHYSFFWFLFVPFVRLGVLEPVLFSGHVLATYFTFWAVWELARVLFNRPLAELLAVAAFIVPHIGLSIFPMFEFSLLNRTAALPCMLFILALYLRGRRLPAFLLLGLLANFHILTAGYALGLLLFDSGLDLLMRRAWRPAVFGLGLFILGALPVLVWRASSLPVQLTPQPDWFTIISQGMFFHLFYVLSTMPFILVPFASGLSVLVLYLAARRERLSPAHDETFARWVAAALLVVVLQVVLAYVWPITFLAQAQIMRLGFLAMVLCNLYFAGYLAARYEAGRLRGPDFGWLTASFIGGVFGFVPLGVWLIQRFLPPAGWRQWAAAAWVGGLSVISIVLAISYQIWSPGIHIYMRPTAWHAAQVWARDHTPKDALFITPLDQWWFYDADWRVFSERGQLASYSDLLEIALVPDHLAVWRPRFEALAPGVIAQFNGNAFENRQRAGQAYNQLSDAALLDIARTYGATYVVAVKPHTHAFSVVYQNEGFIIYDLHAALAP